MAISFDTQFSVVFDSNYNVKRCGRENTKKLIKAAHEEKPDVDFGNLESGMMNKENIISLYKEHIDLRV